MVLVIELFIYIKGAAVNMYTFSFYVAMTKDTSLRRAPFRSLKPEISRQKLNDMK